MHLIALFLIAAVYILRYQSKSVFALSSEWAKNGGLEMQIKAINL